MNMCVDQGVRICNSFTPNYVLLTLVGRRRTACWTGGRGTEMRTGPGSILKSSDHVIPDPVTFVLGDCVFDLVTLPVTA